MRSSAGSIIKLGNNHYKLTVVRGYDANGKRIREYKTVRGSKREASLQLSKMLSSENMKQEKLTFNDVAKEYLESKKSKVRTQTWNEYERVCGFVATAPFATRLLKDVERNEGLITKWLDGLENEWSAKSAYKAMRQVFNFAKRRKYISQSPLDFIDEPKTKRKEIETITLEQLPLYLDAVKGENIEAGVLVMLYMGLRRSEALARKWSDIDFEEHTLFIHSSLHEVAGGGIEFDETKTEKSKRKDYIPEPCFNRLCEIKHGEYLCEFEDHVMRPDYFCRRWRACLKNAGLEFIPVKNLRHSCGTILIREMGANVSDVAELLGHTSTKTTEQYYLQQSDESKKRVANLWK